MAILICISVSFVHIAVKGVITGHVSNVTCICLYSLGFSSYHNYFCSYVLSELYFYKSLLYHCPPALQRSHASSSSPCLVYTICWGGFYNTFSAVIFEDLHQLQPYFWMQVTILTSPYK